jgi:uncharacterized protein (TIGR03382 family)
MPAPNSNGTAGLEVSANVLIATLNGPGAAVPINSNSVGSTSDGELLCDVTLSAAPGGSWDVTSVTFAAAGTGSHDTAYLEVALYQDDGNGMWDGAAIDTLAAPTATGFSTGAVTFALTTTSFPAGTARRFFLTGKLNGTATTGETFNARIESVVATPPAGGTVAGVPSADSTALVIDSAALTVGNAATQPLATIHKGGSAASYTIAKFLLTALNDNMTINAITLTTGGTGDWTSDVDATSGVQVYEDDGDGVFGAGSDTLLYQGAGSAVVTATFGTPLLMPVTSTSTLWVRVGFTATAGIGSVATPETFTLSIAATTDVSASGTVLLGTPLPNGVTIGAIEFAVTTFSPTADLPKGGKAITIQGSGFMTPFVVKIGGIICPGSAAITGGTQVSGLFVPPGGGNNLPIEINSGNLPAQVIGNTFTYSTVGSTNNDGGGSGCAGTGAGWPALLAVVGLMGLAVVRRRRTV